MTISDWDSTDDTFSGTKRKMEDSDQVSLLMKIQSVFITSHSGRYSLLALSFDKRRRVGRRRSLRILVVVNLGLLGIPSSVLGGHWTGGPSNRGTDE